MAQYFNRAKYNKKNGAILIIAPKKHSKMAK